MTRRTQGRGELRADAIYPLAVFLKRQGIGRSTFISLRKRGLPVHNLDRDGRRVFLDGAEVIAFFRKLWAEQRLADPTADAGNPGTNCHGTANGAANHQ
jgi:hypothetical protein